MKVEQYVEAQTLIADCAAEAVERANNFAEKHIPTRYVARAIGSLLAISSMALVLSPAEDSYGLALQRAELECAVAETCGATFLPGYPQLPAEISTPTSQHLATEAPAPVTQPTTVPTVAVVATPTTILGKMKAYAYNASAEFVTPLDPRAEASINAMNLTPEGYQEFLNTIDQSYFDYAQQFIEFNPSQVKIHQGKSEFFTWHFTAFYRNADGPSSERVGDEMTIEPFIEGLARRGDDSQNPNHVCCGVNWLIDRNGKAYQLAPLDAKLRHNPPYDSITTGVEIEAATQGDITTKQYETNAYLTIYVLDQQNLLNPEELESRAKGHGEMRDEVKTQDPNSQWDVRNDFDRPAAHPIRVKIFDFLQANPGLVRPK